MNKRPYLLTLILVVSAVGGAAGPIEYTVGVNTSSLNGTTGSFDLQFNPGPFLTQSAFVQILNFQSDGSLSGPPTLAGDVAGALPGTLAFDNGSGFNDSFYDFTFGDTISFDVNLFGPALSTPDGVSTSGSAFAFSMFSDPGGTVPALTSDTINGVALSITLNLDGTTSVTNSSAQTTVGLPVNSTIPEPKTFLLFGTSMSLLFLNRCAVGRARQKTRDAPVGRKL